MYFSLIPNIEYDEKPISYPFSESDFVTAKNFFRRYRINEDVFSYAVFFNKYVIQDGDRPDVVADKVYGNPFYDWVLLLTNNMVNSTYDWPMTNAELNKVLESEFDDPLGTITYYETYDIGHYTAGMHVDETFFNRTHKLNIDGTMTIKNGNEVCRPVTIAEHYTKENEKKREIFILKPAYFKQFVDDFRKQNFYKQEDNYISNKLKKSG